MFHVFSPEPEKKVICMHIVTMKENNFGRKEETKEEIITKSTISLLQ